MLRARPRGPLSRSWIVEAEDGASVAELDLAMIKEGGRLTYEGRTWRFERERLMSGPWLLKDGAEVVFEARKPAMMRNRFMVNVKNAPLELSPKSWAMRGFALVGPDWRDLGEIRRPSWLSRRVEVDLDAAVPIPAQLFFLCLAIVLWNRADSAAASA